MKNYFKILTVLTLFVGFDACKKKEIVPIAPTMETNPVTEQNVNSVRLNGSIANSGNQDITDYGFVYSQTNALPTTADSKTSHGVLDPTMPTPIIFSDVILSLKPSTTYNVRSYSVIASGEVYGPTITFKTSDILQPTIKTDGSNTITINSAKLQGTVSVKGTFDITEYGICWSSVNTNPTTDDLKSSKTGNITTFPTSFTFDATNLAVNTTYNFRAYVVSNGITTYGNSLNFKTLELIQPTIKTDGSNTITINSAKLQGTISAKGTFDISEYGICWSSTNVNPTTADTKSSKTGNITTFPTSFILDATNLSVNTTYNFRAYVISNGVTTYGNSLNFKTLDLIQPTIKTDGSNTITVNSAKLQGTISAKGTFDITEYGICWSSSNTTPTTADTKVSKTGNITAFPTSFTFDATNLRAGLVYYFRAYVISNGVITYGNTLNFKTADVILPTLSTDGATVNGTASQMQGTIKTKGSYDISEYGMCWSSLNTTPTTADSKGSKAGNPATFPSNYTIDATNLTASKTYYYRAYVISNGTITYGTVLTFFIGKP